jgi:4-amino-4-deoxy-L-arabinose transferase-like glycosyltransferase
MVSAIFLPVLFMQGMFMDGLIYSTVARNMLHSNELFQCFVSDTYLNPFFEQPPLGMLLQSLCIQLTQDVFFVDRLFGFAALIIVLFSLYRIARLFKVAINNSFLPLFILLLIPVVDWSYKNGMLENWMCAFTSLASLFMLEKLSRDDKKQWPFLLSSFFIVAAFLTKGFTGLFPLAIPFIYHVVFHKNLKQGFVDSSKLLLISAFILLLTFQFFPDLKTYFLSYLNKQVLSSLEGNREVDGHFFILKRVPQELIPLFILSSIVFLLAKRKYAIGLGSIHHQRYVVFFLLVTLSGSLPVMISPKQSGYYVLCSYPFFALFFSVLLNDRLQRLKIDYLNRTRIKWLRILSIFTIATSMVVSVVNVKRYYRDREKIQLVDDVSSMIHAEKKLMIDWSIQSDYSLKCYFYRRHFISLYTPNFTWMKVDYFLSDQSSIQMKLVKRYQIDGRLIYLYQH